MPSTDSTPSSNNFLAANHDTWILVGEIDYPVVRDLLAALYRQSLAPKLLLLESPGGLTDATLSLVRELQDRAPTLEIRGLGQVASAAVDLLQAAGLRTAYPHTEFFTHAPRFLEAEDITPDVAGRLSAEVQRNTVSSIRLLASRTKRRAAFWKRFLNEDHGFDAAEALKLGLIDRVL